jgi:hypothetical protein
LSWGGPRLLGPGRGFVWSGGGGAVLSGRPYGFRCGTGGRAVGQDREGEGGSREGRGASDSGPANARRLRRRRLRRSLDRSLGASWPGARRSCAGGRRGLASTGTVPADALRFDLVRRRWRARSLWQRWPARRSRRADQRRRSSVGAAWSDRWPLSRPPAPAEASRRCGGSGTVTPGGVPANPACGQGARPAPPADLGAGVPTHTLAAYAASLTRRRQVIDTVLTWVAAGFPLELLRHPRRAPPGLRPGPALPEPARPRRAAPRCLRLPEPARLAGVPGAPPAATGPAMPSLRLTPGSPTPASPAAGPPRSPSTAG